MGKKKIEAQELPKTREELEAIKEELISFIETLEREKDIVWMDDRRKLVIFSQKTDFIKENQEFLTDRERKAFESFWCGEYMTTDEIYNNLKKRIEKAQRIETA